MEFRVSEHTIKAMQPYLVGGSAAVCAAVAIHPIDLAKLQIQLAGQYNPTARPTFMSVTREVLAKSGPRGLYAGVTAAIARQMIYGTARLGMHRALSDTLQEQRKAATGDAHLPGWIKGSVAAGTGAVAAVLGCPMDVALVRMQAESKSKAFNERVYKSVFQTVYKIAKEEGVSTLWRGTVPLVARGAAMNFGMMASYDQSKEFFVQFNGGKDSLAIQLVCSALSGFVCAFTSLPFDLMKSRLMNMKPDPETGKFPYRGLSDCAMQIMKREGVMAYWRGYWTYYGRCAPNSMITLLLVEQFNGFYKKLYTNSPAKTEPALQPLTAPAPAPQAK